MSVRPFVNLPVERYSLSSSPSSTLISRSLCCLRRGKFFAQCTENVNTFGSPLKMKAVPSPCFRSKVGILIKTKRLIKHNWGNLTLPDAHLNPQSEPFFWGMSSNIWLQLPSHWVDKNRSHSLEKRDGFLQLCCRPSPSAELPQQRVQSLLSAREREGVRGSFGSQRRFRGSSHPFHNDTVSRCLRSRGTLSAFVPAHLISHSWNCSSTPLCAHGPANLQRQF